MEVREPRLDVEGRAAYLALQIASTRFGDAIAGLFKRFGTSQAQYAALWVLCLSDSPEGLPMSVLADGLISRAADVTRLVDRLESRGLAQRRPSLTDRRVTLVWATGEGRDLLARMTPELKALHRRQWQHLDVGELVELQRLLTKAVWGTDTETRARAGGARTCA